jgi:catechol 2,3-dioxygenase-like lactoylglutathione lyase family enzyme
VSDPAILKVDCLRLPVADLEEAPRFYRDGLGQELIWRKQTAAGLRLPDSSAELVVHTEGDRPETDLTVASVPGTAQRIQQLGGKIDAGPFEIAIGLCALVSDPWGNRLVLLDNSKGLLQTDAEGNLMEP